MVLDLCDDIRFLPAPATWELDRVMTLRAKNGQHYKAECTGTGWVATTPLYVTGENQLPAASSVLIGTKALVNSASGPYWVWSTGAAWVSVDANHAGLALASAGTTDLITRISTDIFVTGSNTINSFGTGRPGLLKRLYFGGACTITYNAVSMILPTGASITAAAGDVAIAVCGGSGNWQVVSYTRANGQPLAGGGGGGSGVTDGNKGDITVSGSGATWSLNDGSVTLARLQNITTDTLVGRDSSGTGQVEAIGVTGGIEFSGSGALRVGAFTGDVTKAAGGTALTIADNSVGLTKLADIVTGRFVGRTAAGTGDPELLTGTQATTLLDVFTSALKGLVPASGGGTSNFLRSDGAWASPAGAGTVTNSAGNLTANSVVLGNGTTDIRVVAGITSDGTSKLTLGVAGTSVGGVLLANATSGTVELRPVTGALGTSVLSLPAVTDTVVTLGATQTLTSKTLTSPTLTTPVLGTPASGTLTNCTGLPVASGISGLGTNVAAFLATPSSANLAAALTDETGTGAFVLATSPTLVTPNLGTPSALTLTNATGLPLAGISPTGSTNNDIIQRKSGAWTNRTMAQLAADLNASLLAIAPTITVESTTARTLSAADNNTFIVCTSSSAVAITADTSFSGCTCTIIRAGTGIVSFVASGTTLNGGLVLQGQYTAASLVPTGTANTWIVIGGTGGINNFSATTNPGTGDDSADGYAPGSWWLNTTTNALYICEAATLGNAVWNLLTSGGGSGTVTNTGGNLTSNSVVLGAGTVDTKVVAGITSDGTSKINLGVAGTSVGAVAFSNATSGSITLQPVTGALGTVTLSLPAATDTLVGRATTDTLTNKTLTSPTLTTPVLGTPSSGTLTNCTGLPVSTGISGLATGVATMLATPSSANLAAALTDETGTGSAVFATDATLVGGVRQLAALPGTNNTYQGVVITGRNAGATIAQWDAVYLDASGTWQLADADGTGTFPCQGLAVAAYSSGNAATVLDDGVVRNDSWAWTIGAPVYLSTTAGGLTQTLPTTSGNKQQVIGYALTADSIRVRLGQATYLQAA